MSSGDVSADFGSMKIYEEDDEMHGVPLPEYRVPEELKISKMIFYGKYLQGLELYD